MRPRGLSPTRVVSGDLNGVVARRRRDPGLISLRPGHHDAYHWILRRTKHRRLRWFLGKPRYDVGHSSRRQVVNSLLLHQRDVVLAGSDTFAVVSMRLLVVSARFLVVRARFLVVRARLVGDQRVRLIASIFVIASTASESWSWPATLAMSFWFVRLPGSTPRAERALRPRLCWCCNPLFCGCAVRADRVGSEASRSRRHFADWAHLA